MEEHRVARDCILHKLNALTGLPMRNAIPANRQDKFLLFVFSLVPTSCRGRRLLFKSDLFIVEALTVEHPSDW